MLVDRPGSAPGPPACKAGVLLLDDATHGCYSVLRIPYRFFQRQADTQYEIRNMSTRRVLLPGAVALQLAQQHERGVTRLVRPAQQGHAGLLRRAAALAMVAAVAG
jgi:hypothetical protein